MVYLNYNPSLQETTAMLFNAKNATLKLNNANMDYIRFGSGSKALIILPGLGDGLRTVKGTALPMALMYRKFAKEFTVYAFSRKQPPAQGCTTADMADDLKSAMDILNIPKAHILGVSMGGMIAQHLAVKYPNAVEKLVLTVTCPKADSVLVKSVSEWMQLAKQGDHTAFMDSNVKNIYSDKYYRRSRWLIPIIGAMTKPKSYERFLIQAEACLAHDAYDGLCRISCPTLIIGGEQDRVLGPEGSRLLAQAIPNSRLHMYLHYGHGLYEEAKDFNDVVLDFLTQS